MSERNIESQSSVVSVLVHSHCALATKHVACAVFRHKISFSICCGRKSLYFHTIRNGNKGDKEYRKLNDQNDESAKKSERNRTHTNEINEHKWLQTNETASKEIFRFSLIRF